MSKIKFGFIFMGLVTMIYATIWHFQTRTLRDEAIVYIHNVVFTSPRIVSRIGAIPPGDVLRSDAESLGNRYIYRVYERISTNSSVIVSVSKHEGKWELVSFIYTKNEKSTVLVDCGNDVQ